MKVTNQEFSEILEVLPSKGQNFHKVLSQAVWITRAWMTSFQLKSGLCSTSISRTKICSFQGGSCALGSFCRNPRKNVFSRSGFSDLTMLIASVFHLHQHTFILFLLSTLSIFQKFSRHFFSNCASSLIREVTSETTAQSFILSIHELA